MDNKSFTVNYANGEYSVTMKTSDGKQVKETCYGFASMLCIITEFLGLKDSNDSMWLVSENRMLSVLEKHAEMESNISSEVARKKIVEDIVS